MVSTRKKSYGSLLPNLLKKSARPSTSKGRSNNSHANERPEKSPNVQQPEAPATVFTLFRQLPCEVRVMIWEASITPRLVAVKPRGHAPHSPWLGYIVPAQLSVNTESRECALSRYDSWFTITLTVYIPNPYYPRFRSVKYYANVIMSPDDTLGLLGWESLVLGFHRRYRYRFEVVNANPDRCFGMQPNTPLCGAQPVVNKVAFLTPNFSHEPQIIHILNSTVSWDLSSVFQGEPTKFSKLYPPRGSWYPRPDSPSSEYVWVHSRTFSGNLQEWGMRLFYRAEWNGLAINSGPDILAFELGDPAKKAEEPPSPTDLVRYHHRDPESFYLMREWEWRRRERCPQGF